MRIVGAALLCLISFGCAQVLGLDDYDMPGDGAGASSSQGAGGTGGIDAAGGSGGEVEFSVPEGWEVVSLSLAPDEHPPCGMGWHDGPEGGRDPVPTTPCACSCGSATGSCPTSGDIDLSAGANCSGTTIATTSETQCLSAGG
jgi:hypothetical protein